MSASASIKAPEKMFYDCEISSRAFAGISSRGHVIVIREAPTTSSSESNFTDPESQHYYEDQDEFFNLTVTKLESLSLVNDQATLCYEPISINNDEMPIVKTASVEAADNGGDKGIFSVSRVKKVELSELPLNTTNMCSTRKNRLSHRNYSDLCHYTTFPPASMLLQL